MLPAASAACWPALSFLGTHSCACPLLPSQANSEHRKSGRVRPDHVMAGLAPWLHTYGARENCWQHVDGTWVSPDTCFWSAWGGSSCLTAPGVASNSRAFQSDPSGLVQTTQEGGVLSWTESWPGRTGLLGHITRGKQSSSSRLGCACIHAGRAVRRAYRLLS